MILILVHKQTCCECYELKINQALIVQCVYVLFILLVFLNGVRS